MRMVSAKFLNRYTAGGELAQKLHFVKAKPAVIYAIPRGGVPIGYAVAHTLTLPLDIISARKVGHPHEPEFAVCAVTEQQHVLYDQDIVPYLDKSWLHSAIKREQAEAKRRSRLYRFGRPQLTAAGKLAIIVDDGVATGLTLAAAVGEISTFKPSGIIVAAPVMSVTAAVKLRSLVDDVVALAVPEHFHAVGLYYQHFPAISDEEVIRLLNSAPNYSTI